MSLYLSTSLLVYPAISIWTNICMSVLLIYRTSPLLAFLTIVELRASEFARHGRLALPSEHVVVVSLLCHSLTLSTPMTMHHRLVDPSIPLPTSVFVCRGCRRRALTLLYRPLLSTPLPVHHCLVDSSLPLRNISSAATAAESQGRETFGSPGLKTKGEAGKRDCDRLENGI
jgi:hypothetical protein